MERTMTVRGRYVGRKFIPDGPLPDAEGTAELVITPITADKSGSIADAFGRAPVLRSGDDILAQMRADRDDPNHREQLGVTMQQLSPRHRGLSVRS